LALEFSVAVRELMGIEIDQFQRLLEGEEMLRLPGAGQGLCNFVFTEGSRSQDCFRLNDDGDR